jgi:membrane-associated protease RseP (regulator of RpoE activity)
LVLHVDQLVQNGPAARAGVVVGDRLLALNGQAFSVETASRVFGGLRPGTPITLDLRRDDEHRFVRVVPAARPAEEPRRRTPARTVTVTRRLPQAYVVTSGELRTDGASSLAFTIRRQGQEVQVVPSAIRVRDGALHVAPIDEDIEIGQIDIVEALPIRVDLGRELRAVFDSTYRVWLDKLVTLGERIAVELAPGEPVSVTLDRRRLGSVVEAALGRHLAGAAFEPVRGRVARSLAGIDSGLLVQRVIPGTPAARLGLRPGDVLIEAGGQECTEVEHLRQVLTKGPDEGDVTVKWVRDGTTMTGLLSRP